MNFPNAIPQLVLGGLFLLYGLGILLRQEAQLNLGGGRRGRNPMAVIRLNGISAIIFGLSAVVGGLVVASPFILGLMDEPVSSGMRIGLPIGGVGILVVGLMIATAVQANSGN